MRLAGIFVLLLVAGCAGPTQQAPTAAVDPPVDPVVPVDPAPWGRFDIAITATPLDAQAPARVAVELTIRPTNGIGQDAVADVTWQLEGPGLRRSGQGLGHEETVMMGRGIHVFQATASAPEFVDGHANASIAIHPVPLSVQLVSPENATMGEWFDLVAVVAGGYSDLAKRCTWNNASPAQFEDAMSCATRARWLTHGNQTLDVMVSDEVTMTNAYATVRVLPIMPLAAPSTVPDDALVVDAAGPAADQPYLSHYDVVAAWFDSDLEWLYVGLAVADIDQSRERTATYRVQFTPSWVTADGAGIEYDAFRVVASWSPPDGTEPALPGGVWNAALEGRQGSEWMIVEALPGTVPDAETDIAWWVVPRSALQAPLSGASISSIVAEAGLSAAPGDTWDEASADGPYELA